MCWEHSHLILYCIIIFSLHWTYLLLHIIKSYISYLIHLKCQKPIQRLSSGFNKILYLFIHLGYMYLCITYIIFICYHSFLTCSTFTHYIEQDREQQIQKERDRDRVCVTSHQLSIFPSSSENNTQLYERLYARSSYIYIFKLYIAP